MIPIKLELQGLYSYKEKQTIDFAQLTAAGLFGIFGAVGSGKSSILEAIMLSLYGNTERLAARGEKTSMVNLQSDILSISFEFKAGKNNAETYKASYISKRNKKNFDDVKPAEHNFYRQTAEGWIPIDQRGEDLVGMKMEHFRQTVIIPQGKFRDFIEQKPMARAEMMKELFGLQRFDLSANTGYLLRKNLEGKIRLQTQLQSLEDISLKIMEEKEGFFHELTLKKSAQDAMLIAHENTFNQLKSLQEKHQLFVRLEERSRQLLAQKPAFEDKKNKLQRFRKAVAYIQPILAQLREKEIEIEKNDVSFKECSRWKTDYEEKVSSLETEEQKLKTDQTKKGDREAKIRDLQRIITINSLEKELSQNQKSVDQLLPKSKEDKNQLLRLQKHISDLESKEEFLQVPDAQVLADLKNMVRELNQLELSQKELAADIEVLHRQKTSIEGTLQELRKSVPVDMGDFNEWLSHHNILLEEQHQVREKLIQHQGLSAYASQLQDGQSCPLCGSKDHPEPLPHHFDDARLEENARFYQKIKAEIEAIREHQAAWEKESIQLENMATHLNNKLFESSKTDESIKALLLKLKSSGIAGKEHLIQQLEGIEKSYQEQQLIIQQLKEARGDYRKRAALFEEEEKQLRAAEQKLLTLHTTLATQKGEIKFPDFSFRYIALPEDQIRQDIEKVQKAIDDLELNLKRNQDRLKAARQAQTTNLANLHHFEKQLADTQEKHILLQNELKLQLIEKGFSDKQEVDQLLAGAIDPEKWEAEIKAYENQREVIGERLKELSETREVREYKEEHFQEFTQTFKSQKESLEQLKAQHTLLQKEIEEGKVKLQQKINLEKELEKVEKRELNLKELEKLFKGNGFVKFMSSIYLKELCHTANQRFMKLTKNSLSLEIDEDNNFWVKDYLNGGKKRLLKSLSGGQTFQASLCLALALAEKVKSLNRADQSFFFLDEGFGALDKASLRTVFEALKSLRHENRVVGIISHVEELQQEIEVYAKVDLDSERGSMVAYSF